MSRISLSVLCFPFRKNISQFKILENKVLSLLVLIQDRCRVLTPPSEKFNLWLEKFNTSKGQNFRYSIQSDDAPWMNLKVFPNSIPGMITDEEIQYYEYLGQFYKGEGAVVELGPWLGKSTYHILSGLSKSENFQNKSLYVYDDFVWRPDWMDGYVKEEERQPRHTDFRALFDKYCKDFSHKCVVSKNKIVDYDGNEQLPLIEWSGGKIELIYVDCGRTIKANDGWWTTFSPWFIPGKTLIVMQDWRLHREVPQKFTNQTKLFTDSKGEQIELIHEVRSGGIGTFLYWGSTN